MLDALVSLLTTVYKLIPALYAKLFNPTFSALLVVSQEVIDCCAAQP